MAHKAVGDRTLRGNGSILDKTKLDGGRIIGCGIIALSNSVEA
jgi:hypothetical protein